MTRCHRNRETRPTKRSVRLSSVSKPSVACITSVMIMMLLTLMLMLCRMDNGVHSMVVTTPRRSRIPTTKTANNKHQAAPPSTPDVGIAANNSRSKIETDRNSEEVIRMLLEGQGGTDRRGRKRSQQQQQLPVAPSSSSSRTSDLLDEWRDYEPLRETNMEDDVLRPFFFESGWKRKQLIAQRFGTVIRTLYTAQADWKAFRERKKQLLELGDEDESAKATIAEEETAASIKLCAAVASLGPLAVKLGQTLSQRPDMVGKDACLALKRLQTQTAPFDNELAMAIVRESLEYWDGPLAANLDGGGVNDYDNDNDNDNDSSQNTKPLFKHLSPEPIASASLGQVYKATTWDGVDLALKVQRPDALSVLAIDTQCFRIASQIRNTFIDWTEIWNRNGSDSGDDVPHTFETGMTEEEVRALGPEGTVSSVIDRVARDIQKELDYRVEASNSLKFRKSLDFLGFVDTPEVVLMTPKVLATKFVLGDHLESLEPQQQLALTRMAVEACTASMVLTGFVHADPHEGNLLFRYEDRKIVFLDFGLMSDVEQDIMEAFARGIQALLATDFGEVTEAFSDTGFITRPIMHRHSTAELWKVDPQYGHAELAADLEKHMTTTEGGLTRFGALATVLNKKISPNWLVFTPPYVLLLIRTFLTLEGIAAQVDPDFNIYEMSLPWVVRRSLSPSTEKGQQALRSTILKPDNKVQWERFMELLEMQQEAASKSEAAAVAETAATTTSAGSTPPETEMASMHQMAATSGNATVTPAVAAATTPEEKERKQREYAKARQGAMKDAIGTLLGSTEGKALREVLRDLDTPDLIWKLGSREGRPIVKLGTERFLNKHLFSVFRRNRNKDKTPDESLEQQSPSVPAEEDAADYRPVSEECLQLREQQAKRTKQVTRFLLGTHVRRCLFRVKGIAGMVRLAGSTLQIALSIVLRRALHRARTTADVEGEGDAARGAAASSMSQ